MVGMPPKKERTPELRERLVEAAIAILAEDGVAAVTTRNVAARAQTTAPAIYELFTDKAGLIQAIAIEGFARLAGALLELPPTTGGTADIVVAVQAFRRFTQGHPRLFEVMYSRPFAELESDADGQAAGESARLAFVGRVRACRDAGVIHGDVTDIAHAILALSIGLATQETAGWLATTPTARTRRWDSALHGLLNGFAGGPNRQVPRGQSEAT